MTQLAGADLRRCVEAAFSRQATVERRVLLAGHVLHLRFAGDALAGALLPAFAQLTEASAGLPVSLTVHAWDDESTGLPLPEPAVPAGGGLYFSPGPLRTAFEPGTGMLSAYDGAADEGFLRYRSPASLPVWERSAPGRRLLHWWASRQGMQLVHGAAVGTAEGAVLLVGPSGSGKSTTALAAFGSALSYLGDDYCLVSFEPEPWVHSLYGSGKADAGAAARLPRLRAAFDATPLRIEGKGVVFVTDLALAPAALRLALPLRAVVVPRREGEGAPRLESVSPAAALTALAPSTLLQMPGDREAALARLAALVRAVPCHRLTVGPDPGRALPLLAAICEGKVIPSPCRA